MGKKKSPLRFEVAPNIVEHLGLNLYTNLSRVLVEFVANAYDADSSYVNIKMDIDSIAKTRREIREEHHAITQNDGQASSSTPLEEQLISDDLQIIIEDRGHGMTRDDLQKKFLRIARKRRKHDQGRSPDGRIVMGRKGIGKLAAFGIAHRIEVISKVAGERHATKIALDYEDLIGKETTVEIDVHDEMLTSNINLGRHGTRVILSKLLYEPMGSTEDTIARRVGEHFAIIDAEEFEIRLNSEPIPPFKRKYAYAYPDPAVAKKKLVKKTLQLDTGDEVYLEYRIRFTEKSLSAQDRGVRVYSHQRLAAAPDLLDLGTGMHGFQNTHYLDGVVHANFIEEKRSDYVSSDRKTLRWETPFLHGLRRFLTDEMHAACIAYQNTREETLRVKVRKDVFTGTVIDHADLPTHRRDTAFRIAAKLAAGCGDATKDVYYRETLPVIMQGLGYGELLSAITEISKKKHPSFPDVVATITSLTAAEWDDFSRVVNGRLKGLETLRRIYRKIDFSSSKNENELHKLLQKCPWLIDATFWQFLTSNVSEKTITQKLSKELQIGECVPDGYDPSVASEMEPFGKNKRPDLVFLLNNSALGRLVIVELKAPNTPLHNEHLLQLEDYMRDVREWLQENMKGRAEQLKVEGYLIGERAKPQSRQNEVKRLRDRERKRGPETDWYVFGLHELLTRAEDAHRELLNVQEAVQKAAEPNSS